MGHARELSKFDDDAKIVEYAKNIVDNNLSVRDMENISKSSEVKKKNPINRVSKDREYDYVERELKEFFGTKVKVGNKKIEISFSNNNDLDRILEIMNIKFD
jgi:ParB family chromosome partitioning protein